jgi:hypothetical protein
MSVNTAQISGTVKDKITGERLPFVNIFHSDSLGAPVGNIGTITNNMGSFTVSSGSAFITASFVGYKRQTLQNNGGILHFQLEPTAFTTSDTFTVTALKTRWEIIALAALLIFIVLAFILKKFVFK